MEIQSVYPDVDKNHSTLVADVVQFLFLILCPPLVSLFVFWRDQNEVIKNLPIRFKLTVTLVTLAFWFGFAGLLFCKFFCGGFPEWRYSLYGLAAFFWGLSFLGALVSFGCLVSSRIVRGMKPE